MLRSSLTVVISLLAFPAIGQHTHHRSDAPMETGQSAFAALSEIVQILSDDPATDWIKVNIPALRDHLVDMERVTTEAKVNTRSEARIVEFHVYGAGDVADSIKRMTFAHAPMLEMATGWAVSADPTKGGVIMRIAVATKQDLSRVLGLGFFGVLTIGAHHQAHHMQIALGMNPHH